MQKRLFILILVSLSPVAGFSQNVSEQTRKLGEIEKEIEFLDKQLAANRTNQQRSLEDITLVQQKIANRKEIVAQLSGEILTIDLNIQSIEQKIDSLTQNLERLKSEYAYLVYHAYKNRDRTTWVLQILASKSIGQGYRRWSYLKSYSETLRSSAVFIKEQGEKLSVEKELLGQTRSRSVAMQEQQRAESTKLETEEKDLQQLVAQFSRSAAEFRRQLDEKRREAEQLNREIERILAEAARERGAPNYVESAVDRVLTGDFESNKGRLPWPVRDGVIIERFGQHNNPLFPNTQQPFNRGVNISTDSHAEAFCIFDGIVKQVFILPGYSQCIMVQHGSYYTLYTKLERITVKNGDNVKRGQVLGTLAEIDGTSVIHFELWKGADAQNPEQWISK